MLPEENDDLQHDDSEELETEVDDVEDVEPDEQDSDSEPDSDGEHEEKDAQSADKKQDSVEQRIGELTRKRHEAERIAKEREQELRDLRKQLLTNSEPVVPELPDPDDVSQEEFQSALRQREEMIQKRIEWQQQKTQFENEGAEQTRNEQLRQQQELQTIGTAYRQKAATLGVKEEELAQAGNLISQVGLHNDVAMEILRDDVGPLITRHLAQNVSDLLEVSQMSPTQAVLYIERNIKPKVKPAGKRTKAVKPPKREKGQSRHSKSKYPLTSGATFE